MLQLTFNPGLTLTGFRTTRPWNWDWLIKLQLWMLLLDHLSFNFESRWLIELSDNKLFDNNLASELVELIGFLRFEIGWVLKLVSIGLIWFYDTQLITPYQAIYSEFFYRPSHTRPLCLDLLCHCSMQLKLHIACRSVMHERYQHTLSCCLFQTQGYRSKEQHLRIDAVVKSGDLLDAAVVSPGEN